MQQEFGPDLAGIIGVVIAVMIGVLLVLLVVAVFYLLTLQTALSRVAPHNRKMEPGMVWLSLIPCVNIVWQFFIAIQVPDSLKAEFQERGRDDGSDYGKSIALTNCILGLATGVVTSVRATSPEMAMLAHGLNLVAAAVQLTLFIMFWVKIANYSAVLAAEPADSYRDRRLDAFDDDDRYGGPTKGEPSGPSDAIKPGDPGEYH